MVSVSALHADVATAMASNRLLVELFARVMSTGDRTPDIVS